MVTATDTASWVGAQAAQVGRRSPDALLQLRCALSRAAEATGRASSSLLRASVRAGRAGAQAVASLLAQVEERMGEARSAGTKAEAEAEAAQRRKGRAELIDELLYWKRAAES